MATLMARPADKVKERRMPTQRNKAGDKAWGDFASAYTCGWRHVTIGRVGRGLRLTDGADVFNLEPEADGADNVFKGGGPTGTARVRLKNSLVAHIDVNGKALSNCVLTHDWPMAAFRATGHEPAWLVKSDAELTHFTVADKLYSGRSPDGQTLALGKPLRLGPDPDAPEVTVYPRLCRDALTGLPLPYAVEVVYAGRLHVGCGGEAGTLLNGRNWVVTALAARPFNSTGTGNTPLSHQGHNVTLRFDGKGKVSGEAHCNRFSGSYSLTEEGLTIGSLGVTRRACLGTAMQDERAFLKVLETVVNFYISPTGELTLITREAAEQGVAAGIQAR